MGDRTAIEWTDATWNPLVGCSRVSPGCTNCYAERVVHRGLAPQHRGLTRLVNGTPHWTGEVRLVESALGLPLAWKKPRRVFVNSLSDLFHEAVEQPWIGAIFNVMARARQHTYQVLTKRPERMARELALIHAMTRGSALYEPWPLPNVWLGVSAEDAGTLDERAQWLKQTPAAVRFLSLEPLLGPMPALGWHLRGPEGEPLIHWVIVGGESAGPPERALVERCTVALCGRYRRAGLGGHGCTRCGGTGWALKTEALTWVRSLRDQCVAAGVPFFFKQFGGPTPKSAGRELDGRTWERFPT